MNPVSYVLFHCLFQALENGENGRNVIMPFKRRSLSVRVQNPLTHIPLDGKRYTTYEIAVEVCTIVHVFTFFLHIILNYIETSFTYSYIHF